MCYDEKGNLIRCNECGRKLERLDIYTFHKQPYCFDCFKTTFKHYS